MLVTPQLKIGAVEIQELPVQTHNAEGGQRMVQRIAFKSEQALGLLAFVDRSNDDRQAVVVIAARRFGDRQFGGKAAAIAAQGGDYAARQNSGVVRGGAARGGEQPAQLVVIAVVQQALQRLAEDFSPVVAKELLSALIDKENVPRAIHHQDRIVANIDDFR